MNIYTPPYKITTKILKLSIQTTLKSDQKSNYKSDQKSAYLEVKE